LNAGEKVWKASGGKRGRTPESINNIFADGYIVGKGVDKKGKLYTTLSISGVV